MRAAARRVQHFGDDAPPRPGESHARDYHYVRPDEFERMCSSGELLEWANVYGHHYGTPLSAVQGAVDAGRTVILEIDVQGCVQVRKKLPQAQAYFILPPNPEEQRRRIEGRQTDAKTVIQERLAKADGEIRFAHESGCYDQFLVNDDLESTISGLCELIQRNTVSAGEAP